MSLETLWRRATPQGNEVGSRINRGSEMYQTEAIQGLRRTELNL